MTNTLSASQMDGMTLSQVETHIFRHGAPFEIDYLEVLHKQHRLGIFPVGDLIIQTKLIAAGLCPRGQAAA